VCRIHDRVFSVRAHDGRSVENSFPPGVLRSPRVFTTSPPSRPSASAIDTHCGSPGPNRSGSDTFACVGSGGATFRTDEAINTARSRVCGTP
jgi:hypothetical protein